MPGRESLDRQLELEVTQCIEEGVLSGAAREAGVHARDVLAARAQQDEMRAAFACLPKRRDLPFHELDEIR